MNPIDLSKNLNQLKAFFEREGIPVEIQPPTEANNKEQLLLVLGQTSEKEKILLRIGEVPSASPFDALLEEEKAAMDEVKMLQFFVLLPFYCAVNALGEVKSFILRINSLYDMAQFGLFEADRLLYYRYVIPLPEGILRQRALEAIMGSIDLIFGVFLLPLTEVAKGKKKIADLENEAKRDLQELYLED